MVVTTDVTYNIIKIVQCNYPDVSPRSAKFITLVAIEADKHDIPDHQVAQLALQMGLKMYPRPKNVPETWKVKLCKNYLAQRYENPGDPFEYVVVLPGSSIGRLPYVIHRTPVGYADPTWFLEIVPQLQKILKDPTLGHPFTRRFNKSVNEILEKQPRGILPGQIKALTLFFEQYIPLGYVPQIEGVCGSCFKISLPDGGAGEKWTHRSDETYEVRLSAAKANPLPGQQTPYVTHREVSKNKTILHAFWNTTDKKVGPPSPSNRPEGVHIPWEDYDYNKFCVDMPVCTCVKKALSP